MRIEDGDWGRNTLQIRQTLARSDLNLTVARCASRGWLAVFSPRCRHQSAAVCGRREADVSVREEPGVPGVQLFSHHYLLLLLTELFDSERYDVARI